MPQALQRLQVPRIRAVAVAVRPGGLQHVQDQPLQEGEAGHGAGDERAAGGWRQQRGFQFPLLISFIIVNP